MTGNGGTYIDGIGTLTYQRAIDIARNTEGELDERVKTYLDNAIDAIWSRITLEPDAYVLTKDEFAVFNYFISRFNGNTVAEFAIARYWKHTGETRT